ncbi:aspartyl/asparaginyl beta-hydroxylase domain-containing protein [Staphylococcus ureilyticus]|nr:aspartyl/asparaginyl beta-hydroxylase domain-containing protein [Staphylococcus ureilyticus]
MDELYFMGGASEDEKDTQYRDYNHEIKQTSYGKQLPYISNFIQENFNIKNLKMVRTRNLVDALIMPHRDFVDLNKEMEKYFRVFIPLETNELAFHSDEDNVFCMKKGGIWFLDAGIIHAAANFSNKNRLFLCLDFVFDEPYTPKDIFTNKNLYDENINPYIVEREEVDSNYGEEIIRNLSNVIHHYTFKEIVFLLSKLHFYKKIPIDICYRWLLEISKRTNDKEMIKKAKQVNEYLIEKRELGEHFSFSDWST